MAQQLEFNFEGPFTEGSQPDEIQLQFDDGTTFFVSKSFLSHASPVFERMFTVQFHENIENCVKLRGKNSEAFHEMLLFLHPRIQRPLTGGTAMKIYQYAHEYEIPTALTETERLLEKELESLTNIRAYAWILNRAFDILLFAEKYENDKLRSCACERISVMPSETFMKHINYKDMSEKSKQDILTCRLKRTDRREVLPNKI